MIQLQQRGGNKADAVSLQKAHRLTTNYQVMKLANWQSFPGQQTHQIHGRLHTMNRYLPERCTLELIGGLFLFYTLIYRPVRFLLSWALNQCQCASARVLNPGADDYAVITGATDGIGLEYAKQLAERGYNLVLLSRSEEKLARVAQRIVQTNPGCRIETLAVDFSQTDIYESIQKKLESISGRIHVLVNNVGICHNVGEMFLDFPPDYSLKVIHTNILSMTRMSEIGLRLMLNNPKGASTAKGVIINIGSSFGLTELPFLSTYCASKAYVNCLSRILSYEYGPSGILVQTVTPNLVDTPMSRDVQDPFFTVPAPAFVRAALATVGTESETNGHPWHKFMTRTGLWIGERLPRVAFMKWKYLHIKLQRKAYYGRLKKTQAQGVCNQVCIEK